MERKVDAGCYRDTELPVKFGGIRLRHAIGSKAADKSHVAYSFAHGSLQWDLGDRGCRASFKCRRGLPMLPCWWVHERLAPSYSTLRCGAVLPTRVAPQSFAMG